MQVGLFIPCYIDQFYPQVGWATMEVLSRYGYSVDFPSLQTCCGQPMANTGCNQDTLPLALRFYQIFQDYDYVVCPSGSCVSMVRNHYESYFPEASPFHTWKGRVMELCEFLTDVVRVDSFDHPFPYRVGLHRSCHGLRELRLDACSERMEPFPSKVHDLLRKIPELELIEVPRDDECCGFGGTFAVNEEAVSVRMGQDRLSANLQSQVEVLTATDMSCLMHMEGLARRQKQPIHIMHIAEILAGRLPKTNPTPSSRPLPLSGR